MKFVTLFALFCAVASATAERPKFSHEEAANAARNGRLAHLGLEVEPAHHESKPLSHLNIDATLAPVAEEHNEAVTEEAKPATEEAKPVTEEAKPATEGNTETATELEPATEQPEDNTETVTDLVTEPATGDDDKPKTDKPESGDDTPATTSSSDDTTDSTGSSTDEPATDSTNGDKNGENKGEQKEEPKGLSTATISAIVIGGVLVAAVVVALGVTVVRRRRAQSPERRGILDA